jgi:hypothetical protein
MARSGSASMESEDREMCREDLPMSKVVDTTISDNGDAPRETKSPTGAENKNTLSLKDEPLYVQAAYEFLGRKGVTLWADFIVAQDHGRLRAARWLAKEMAGVEKILTSSWLPE